MKNSQSPGGRRPVGSAGLLVAIFGLGFAIWYGWEWYRLPTWSEAEIEQSVELNLALDLSRRSGPELSEAEVEQRREQVDAEVRANIAAERDRPRSYALTGLIVGLVGLAQMGAWLFWQRR